jgi:hypothetical protein
MFCRSDLVKVRSSSVGPIKFSYSVTRSQRYGLEYVCQFIATQSPFFRLMFGLQLWLHFCVELLFRQRSWLGYCSSECKISTPATELDRLKTELLCSYDRSFNPKTSGSNKTNVKMLLALRRFTFVSNYCERDIVRAGKWREWEKRDTKINWVSGEASPLCFQRLIEIYNFIVQHNIITKNIIN